MSNAVKKYFRNVAILFTMALIVFLIGVSLFALTLFLKEILIDGIEAVIALTDAANMWLTGCKWFVVGGIPSSLGGGFFAGMVDDELFN